MEAVGGVLQLVGQQTAAGFAAAGPAFAEPSTAAGRSTNVESSFAAAASSLAAAEAD